MKNSNHIKIVAFAALTVLSFLAELYVMVNHPDNMEYMFLFGVFTVVFIMFFALSVLKESQNKAAKREEQFDSILKSEKASYLTMRSNFEKMGETLQRIEEGNKLPAEELLQAQKAIAKVNIARNKENADAILNSNDLILNRLVEMEKYMQGDSSDELVKANQKVLGKSQEILSELKNVEFSIRSEILSLKSSGFQMGMPMQMPQMGMPMAGAPMQPAQMGVQSDVPLQRTEPEMEETIHGVTPHAEPEDVLSEMLQPETESEMESAVEPELEPMPEPELESETDSMPELEPEPELAQEAFEPEPEPAPAPMPQLSDDPNHVMTPEEIAALLNSTAAAQAAPEAEPEPEPEPAPAPMPQLSDDPNHVMTPEEIAALIDSTAAAQTAPEPEPEPEPEPAPMSQLSDDPNHIMTPEEIAALLAANS